MAGNEVMDVSGMAMIRAPEAVLAEAKKAAVALQGVIKGKLKPVIFNGEQYIEFEDWQVLGRFYGLAAKVVSTTHVEFGGVRGFEARAVAIDVRTGVEVSAAEAMCLNDEEKWSARTKYEYKDVLDKDGKKIWVADPKARNGKGYYKSEKIAAGEVAVPMFQLRSMAQTRACAKALRNILAWVVVLAGYKPSVAEEMTGDEQTGNPPKEVIGDPQRASETAAAAAAQEGDAQESAESESGILPANAISVAQVGRFYAKCKSSGKTEEQVKHYLKMKIGSESSKHITKDVYEACCAWADKKE